jgi:hypothetical protein
MRTWRASQWDSAAAMIQTPGTRTGAPIKARVDIDMPKRQAAMHAKTNAGCQAMSEWTRLEARCMPDACPRVLSSERATQMRFFYTSDTTLARLKRTQRPRARYLMRRSRTRAFRCFWKCMPELCGCESRALCLHQAPCKLAELHGQVVGSSAFWFLVFGF